jgi:serine/threonine-protein kinase
VQLAEGEVVEKYRVEGVLGQGGMAVVYLVRHAQLGTTHALKVLTLSSPSIRERLLQEGRVQASLQHPNIVSVTDVIDVAGAPGLVMEHVNGASLDRLLETNRLSFEQVDILARDILAAVAFAHRQGLIHRDLKPANVLLAIRGTTLVPKITDFGLAKVLAAENGRSSNTRTGATMGTPHYMAPEQIRDAKNVGPEADVFALGAILYELLTGQRAFDGNDLFEIFKAVAEGRYTPLRELVPDVPERMEHAIQAALEVDKAQRVADVDQLLALWTGEVRLGATGAAGLAAPVGPWDASILASVGSLSAPSQAPASGGTGRTPAARSEDTWMADPDASARKVEPAPSFVGSMQPVSAAPPSAPSLTSELRPQPAPRARSGLWGVLLGLIAGGGVIGVLAVVALALIVVLGGVVAFLVLQPSPAPRPPRPGPAEVVVAPAPEAPAAPVTPNGKPAPARPVETASAPAPTVVHVPDRPAPTVVEVPTAPAATVVEPAPEKPARPPSTRRFQSTAEAPPLQVLAVLPPGLDPRLTRNSAKRIEALTNYERSPLTTPIIWTVLYADPDPEVRRKAWRVVRARVNAGIGDRRENEAITLWVSHHGDASVQAEAIATLGSHGISIDPVVNHLWNPDVGARLAAVAALEAWAKGGSSQRAKVDDIFEERATVETDGGVLAKLSGARR